MRETRRNRDIIILGIALLVLHAAITALSREFAYTRPLAEKPVLALVAMQLAAGAAFLLAVRSVVSASHPRSNMVPWIIGVGFALRAVTLPSTPILENDFYRYLWDGALTAHGVNPYLYAPIQALDPGSTVPPLLRSLAEQSGEVIFRAGYPEIRTIYPPVAQAAFAASYLIQPWSLWAWKAVLASFDVVMLILLLIALRGADAPAAAVAIYWWNPLVVREIFNAMHMDIMVAALAFSAVLLSSRKRHFGAMVALTLAVGSKVWPVILIPLILAPLMRAPRKAALLLAFFAAGCALMAAPMILSRPDSTSGILAYGKSWEMNDAFYMLFLTAVESFGKLWLWNEEIVQIVTRLLVGLMLVGWSIWLSREGASPDRKIWDNSLLVVASLFLLSPTQFPWYYLWVMPFLVMRCRLSLLLLSVLLSVYYVRFFFVAYGNVDLFDNYVVWVEYAPVGFLVVREWLLAKRRPTLGIERQIV